jgi:hypothetical protein
LHQITSLLLHDYFTKNPFFSAILQTSRPLSTSKAVFADDSVEGAARCRSRQYIQRIEISVKDDFRQVGACFRH